MYGGVFSSSSLISFEFNREFIQLNRPCDITTRLSLNDDGISYDVHCTDIYCVDFVYYITTFIDIVQRVRTAFQIFQ